MNAKQLRRRRAASQLLYRSEPLSPEQVVGHMLCVQAQDRRGGRLALRARSEAFDAAGVEHALAVERSLIFTWVMRGTIHLIRPDELPWLLAVFAPVRAKENLRRLRGDGISEERANEGVRIIDNVLREEGPLSRADLRERLLAASFPSEGQALPHVIGVSAYAGVSVVGPQQSGKAMHVSASDWLGTDIAAQIAKVDREKALAELARRCLESRGPASVVDMAYWTGLPQRDILRGLDAIAPQLTELADGLLDLKSKTVEELGPLPARLLHTWDDYMLSWKDRSFMLPDEHKRAVIWGGGMFASTATVDGLVKGGWSAPVARKPFSVEIDEFEPLGKKAIAELERDAADIARFEGR